MEELLAPNRESVTLYGFIFHLAAILTFVVSATFALVSGQSIEKVRPGVTAPILIKKVEPEYSEEAQKARYSGSVLLAGVVDAKGVPRDIHVTRSLGLGLDEKAIQAVL